MNDKEYYISRPDGTQEGPYTEEQLVSRINAGKYPPDTLVWTEGMDEWAEMSRLFPIAEKTEQPDLAADSSEQSTSLKAQHKHYLCIKDKILTLWKTNLKWCVAACGIVGIILSSLCYININNSPIENKTHNSSNKARIKSYPSQAEVRKLLTEQGIIITSYNKALTQAIKIKDTELIKLLFIAGLDDDGLEKAIKFFIEENHIELASFILSNSHNSKLFSRRCLYDIIEYNRQEILKLYLASSSFNLSDLNNSHALIRAVLDRRFECLQQLLSVPGIDVNVIDGDGDTVLMVASRDGHPECVRMLLATPGIDVNVKDGYENTALIKAARNGHTECVRMLLAAPRIDVNAGRPLIDAARNGHTECVRMLLAAPGIEVNVKDSNWDTALSRAAENGHTECVRMLLAAPRIEVNVKDRNENTALIEAVKKGHGKCAQFIVNSPKVDISNWPPIYQAIIKNQTATLQEMSSISIHNKYKYITPLQLACLLNRLQCVRILLAAPGIDVNDGGPLIDAARNGHTECVRMLLAAPGIDVNDGGPLLAAAENGHTECVRLLISAPKIRVNKVANDYYYKKSALHYAAENGHTECVRLLLTTPDINVNNEAEDHITALYLAAANGHTKCVQLLLAAPKIDVNTVYRSGLIYDTPLSGAARNGHTECVRMLLAAPGIEVNEGNALYSAVAYGHIECVRLLLAAPGIDPNQKGGNYNRRPLKIAKSRRDAKCERLLIAAGAKE